MEHYETVLSLFEVYTACIMVRPMKLARSERLAMNYITKNSPHKYENAWDFRNVPVTMESLLGEETLRLIL